MVDVDKVAAGPEWVNEDTGYTCIDCKYLSLTSKECGGSEKHMCEKYNFLLSGDIDKQCKEFEEA